MTPPIKEEPVYYGTYRGKTNRSRGQNRESNSIGRTYPEGGNDAQTNEDDEGKRVNSIDRKTGQPSKCRICGSI